MKVTTIVRQSDNWVAHELARPMVCDVAAPICRVDGYPLSRQHVMTNENVSEGASPSDSHTREMLNEKESVTYVSRLPQPPQLLLEAKRGEVVLTT